MEPEVREYLKRILNTISVGLLWMLINSTAGIMFGYAFTNGHLHTGNIIFYAWFVISLAFFIRYIVKLWSKPIFSNKDPQS